MFPVALAIVLVVWLLRSFPYHSQSSWSFPLRTTTSGGRASSSSQIPAAPSQVDIHATALDRFVGQGKHKDSSLRRKVLEWRFSEAGKAWQQQRESILGKDACEDEADLHDGEIAD